jgi:hypothetical protein
MNKMKKLNMQGAIKILGKNVVDYSKLITHIFPLEVLEQYADKLEGHWWRLSKHQPLTETFMRKFETKLNWEMISQYQKLSEGFIDEFQCNVNWLLISQHQRLSEKFIFKFSHKVDWDCISEYQKLSEDFMIKCKDKVNWLKISQFQKMSLDFIEEMWLKVDRKAISEHQILTEEFVWQKRDKLHDFALDQIIKRIQLSESLLTYIVDNLRGFTQTYIKRCLEYIVCYQKLSLSFCMNYESVLPLSKLVYNKVIPKEEREQILTTIKIVNKLA